jgi:thiamine phosphate synthase YjbQ (UPF0047 family)
LVDVQETVATQGAVQDGVLEIVAVGVAGGLTTDELQVEVLKEIVAPVEVPYLLEAIAR